MELILITEKARECMVAYMTSRNCTTLLLQLAVGGCVGYKYELKELASSAVLGCNIHPIAPGFSLAVREDQAHLLDGTIVDHVQEGLNSRFTYDNPQVTHACGCGESVRA